MQTFNLFVSSPGDVKVERQRVENIVSRLNGEFGGAVVLKAIRWETEHYQAFSTFQAQIPPSIECDLVIGILKWRLGTELPPDFDERLPDDRPYPSGTAYEILTAVQKRQKGGTLPDIYVFRFAGGSPTVPLDDPDRPKIEREWQALKSFFQEWFVTEGGHFLAAFNQYSSEDDFETQLEELLRKWLADKVTGGRMVHWPIAVKGSPFRGLEPFEVEHAAVFFGRERAIEVGRKRLVEAAAKGTPFLLVVGASGAGKSSLARAGLIARLTTPGVVPTVDIWRDAVMKPGEGEAGPILALAAAFCAALPELAQGDFPKAEALADHLRRGGTPATQPILGALTRIAQAEQRKRNSDQPLRPALLLLVDQLEELFAQAITKDERAAFVAALKELVATGQVWCIATLRADLYEPMLRQPLLGDLKERGASFDLGPPRAAELDKIVRAPAAAAGLEFEQRGDERLDDALLAAAGGNADALPLLGFTLQWLYENREGERLTFAAYVRLGGLEGAIAKRADETLAGLDAKTQEALPRILRALATVDHQVQSPSARVASLESFVAGSPERALIDAFVGARLFVSDEGKGRANAGTIRVAHEAVLTHWPRARDQIEKDRVNLQVRSRLEPQAALWRVNRDDSRLVQAGTPFQEAERLLAEWHDVLTADLREFIERSTERVIFHDAAAQYRAWAERKQRKQLEEARYRSTPVDPNSPEERLHRAEYWIVTAQQAASPLPERQAAAAQALAILNDLTKADPTHWPPRRMLAICHMTIGDLAAETGARAGARAAYGEAIAALERAGSEHTDAGEAQRMRAVIHLREGDLLRQEGKNKEVLEAYGKSLSMQEELTKRNPTRTDWLEDLCKLHGQIGGLLQRQGDIAEAIKSYKAALIAAERFPRQALGNQELLSTLASLHQGLGYAQYNQDQSNPENVESALAAYARARTIIQILVDLYRGYAPYRREWAIVTVRIGDLLSQQDKCDDALRVCQDALGIMRELAAQDERNLNCRRDLALALHKLGDVTLKKNPSGALDSYRECKAIRTELQQHDPANNDLLFELAFTDERIAKALAELGKFDEAVSALQQGLQIAQDACKAVGGNPERQGQVAFMRASLAEIHDRAKHPKEAAAEFRNALETRQDIVKKYPQNPRWIREVLYSHRKLAEVLERDEPDSAKSELEDALACSRELITLEGGARKARDEEAMIQEKLAALAVPSA